MRLAKLRYNDRFKRHRNRPKIKPTDVLPSPIPRLLEDVNEGRPGWSLKDWNFVETLTDMQLAAAQQLREDWLAAGFKPLRAAAHQVVDDAGKVGQVHHVYDDEPHYDDFESGDYDVHPDDVESGDVDCGTAEDVTL